MKLIYRIKLLCSKCTYILEQIRTVTNPWPQCKANGCQSFEWFKREQSGNKRGGGKTLPLAAGVIKYKRLLNQNKYKRATT